MAEHKQPSEVVRLLILLWARLSDERRTDAVVSLAGLALRLAQDTSDEKLEGLAHSWLEIASKEYRDGSGSAPVRSPGEPHCSFCGKGKPEVLLAAGAPGFICDACVGTLSEIFAAEREKGRKD
jgi:hypothetical protein